MKHAFDSEVKPVLLHVGPGSSTPDKLPKIFKDYHEVQPTLSEWRRVLNDEGFAMMTMPDLQQAAQMIADGRLTDTIYESPVGPVTPLDMVFGHSGSIEHGYSHMQHRTGFTASRLKSELHAAKFMQVNVRCDGLNLFAQASKELPSAKSINFYDQTVANVSNSNGN